MVLLFLHLHQCKQAGTGCCAESQKAAPGLWRRLPKLAALSVDMHPAPLIEAEDGELASAPPLQPWTGGPLPPLGLCRLSSLTELDFSLRAFASPAIAVPEVGGAATSSGLLCKPSLQPLCKLNHS